MVDETSMLNKVPPHSLEAEQSVLGAMLLDKDAIAKAIDILVVDDVYGLGNCILVQKHCSQHGLFSLQTMRRYFIQHRSFVYHETKSTFS